MQKISGFLVLAALLGACSHGEQPATRPNIILIMADDLGYECMGCYGGVSHATPNLDALAEGGMRFSYAYSQPLCTNTRTELMTGKYLHHNWVAFGILDPAEKTFGHLMKDQDYATCIVGKWQLQSYDPPGYPGSELRRGIGMHPGDAGFDEYCLYHTGHTEDKGSRYADPHILQNGEFLENTVGKYGPDIFTAYLNDFASRNREKPFFIYYPMALTHGPFVPTPDSEDWQDESMRHTQDTAYFGDMVRYCDKIVGKIVGNLEDLGLDENTLILFYSDNGTHQELYSTMNGQRIKGGKGLTTDAGIRVPMIASWKGTIPSGILSDELVYSCDFLPTILEAAGSAVPVGFKCDGESFLSILQGKEAKRRDWIYTDFNPLPGWDKDQFEVERYVMDRDYKLYEDGRFYRWSEDPLEIHPLDAAFLDEDLLQLKKKFQHILDSIPASAQN